MESTKKRKSEFANHYNSSIEHLLDELKRIDILIMGEIKRIREQISKNPMQGYGISDDEVNGLLAQFINPLLSGEVNPVDPDIQTSQLLDLQTGEVDLKKQNSLAIGLCLRLERLGRLFSLSQCEVDILLICLAPEISERYQRFYGYIQDDKNKVRPSVNTILNLLQGVIGFDSIIRLRTSALFSDKATLLNHGLVHWIEESGRTQPLLNKYLKVDKRIQSYLLESDETSSDIDIHASCIQPESSLDSLLLDDGFKKHLIALTKGTNFGKQSLVLYFQGGYGLGKQTIAEALCRILDLKLIVVDISSLLGLKAIDFQNKIIDLLREAWLQNAALYFRDFDALVPQREDSKDEKNDSIVVRDESLLKILINRLEQWRGICFFAGDVVWEPKDILQNSSFHRLQIPYPNAAEREQLWSLWKAEYPVFAKDVDITGIAAQFQLSGGQIRDALNTATSLSRWRDPVEPQITNDDLNQACRLQSNRQLASLSQKITPHYDWEDLILPPRTQQILEEIRARVTYRALVYEKWGFDKKLAMGKGLHLLFSGAPGTGKTMAAEVLANVFKLDLYKIDLSSMVSKYIGETEKNLSKVFHEGETSNAILFFDEADALFGKRSETKDSHDRHANIEVSYLLQRMEAYSGIVILSTNFRRNMDDAFTRRLHYCVDFPMPEKPERLRIWKNIWPEDTPCSKDIDIDFLAERLEIAGGYIRNIALAAAFMAADEARLKNQNAKVSMSHLIQASRREYQKMGQILKKDLLSQ